MAKTKTVTPAVLFDLDGTLIDSVYEHVEASVAGSITHLQDDFVIDYALQKTFSPPRSMMTFSERGRGIAKDIWDGNDPAQVRRFSEAVLKLRNEPNLLQELIDAGKSAICPVLVIKACAQQQHRARSVFFLYGTGEALGRFREKARYSTVTSAVSK